MAKAVFFLTLQCLLLPTDQSSLTNPLKPGGDISQVVPSYLMTSTTKKAYYNETPAVHLIAGDVQKKRHATTGKHESCSNIDFKMKWSATVSSSVYSTPLVFLSTAGGGKHILVNTFYQTLEMLESTGFKPWGWPITFEGSTFQGTPILYDVDGDGIDDIGVVDKNANVYFVKVGEFGQYLEDYHMQVPSLQVKKDWHVGLDADFMDYNSMMSMFDKKGSGYTMSGSRPTREGEKTKVIKADDLSLNKPPPKSATSEHAVRVPRRAASSPDSSSRRRLLEIYQKDEQDDVHSFRGAANHHGIQAESAETGGPSPSVADFGAMRPEDFPPSARTDDYDPSKREFYYGGGRGLKPFRSYDDGYHYDMMGFFNESNFVNIDPHVLGSPVLVDVNNDGRMELIMAVSYYFDKAEHAAMHAKGIDFDPDNYIAGGIVCWDLQSQEWAWTVHLDLTTDKTKFKALIYATPTVADIDGDGRSEVVIGTSLGLLYVLDGETGFAKRHFPMQFHEIQAQVAVADVHGGLHLEIIVADMGGNLVLLNIDGEILWDAKLSGTLPYTPTVGDVDGDGHLDIVVVAVQDSTSHLWVVEGATGVALLGYPIKLSSNGLFSASALLVDLSVMHARGSAVRYSDQAKMGIPMSSSEHRGLHIIIPSFDGFLYIIDGVKKCYDRIDVGDHIYATPLLDDVTGDGALDIILGTINGQVLAIETTIPNHPKNAWPSFPKHRNGFTFGQTGIMLKEDLGLDPRKNASVEHQNYNLAFEIWDTRKEPVRESADAGNPDHAGTVETDGMFGKERRYSVTIAPNANQAQPLFSHTYTKPGIYTVSIAIQPPEHLALVIAMVNEHGQLFEDSLVIQVTTTFHQSIKFLSLSVIVGLAGLLTLLS